MLKKINKTTSIDKQYYKNVSSAISKFDPVFLYMKDMGKVKTLNREEEIDLAKKIESSVQTYIRIALHFPKVLDNLVNDCIISEYNPDQLSQIFSGAIIDKQDKNNILSKKDILLSEQDIVDYSIQEREIINNAVFIIIKNYTESGKNKKDTIEIISKEAEKLKFTRSYTKKIFDIIHGLYMDIRDLQRKIRDHCYDFNIDNVSIMDQLKELGYVRFDYIKENITECQQKQKLSQFSKSIKKILKDIKMSFNQFKNKHKDFINAYEEEKHSKKTMVESNLRLVISYAAKQVKKNLSLQFLDYVQFGNIGLIRAVDKFEWRMGYKFSTYSCCWIQQSISRAIADQSRIVRIPVHLIETINRISRASKIIWQKKGVYASEEELSQITKIPINRISQVMKISKEPISTDTPIGEDSEISLGDLIPDNTVISPIDNAIDHNLRLALQNALKILEPREAKVLSMRFGLDMSNDHTLEEVGKAFEVTRERIRQLQDKSIKKLRRQDILDILKDFIS